MRNKMRNLIEDCLGNRKHFFALNLLYHGTHYFYINIDVANSLASCQSVRSCPRCRHNCFQIDIPKCLDSELFVFNFYSYYRAKSSGSFPEFYRHVYPLDHPTLAGVFLANFTDSLTPFPLFNTLRSVIWFAGILS